MRSTKLKLLTAMGIFGTVGIFVRFIPLPSATIAFCRGALGCIFLLLSMTLTGEKISRAHIQKNLWVLLISGAAIGFNWILLFESYRYTTVAIATICYYLAPAFATLASPLVGEKLTGKKLLCVGIALLGMVFVSGVLNNSGDGVNLAGILTGVGAAVLYASVMLLNRKLTDISANEKTVMQLGTASLVIVPYLLLSNGLYFEEMTPFGWCMLLVVGIVHTGFAYSIYFGSINELNTQTVAVFSYLDPVISILLSALLLKENLDIYGVIGAVLILGSALYSELSEKRN